MINEPTENENDENRAVGLAKRPKANSLAENNAMRYFYRSSQSDEVETPAPRSYAGKATINWNSNSPPASSLQNIRGYVQVTVGRLPHISSVAKNAKLLLVVSGSSF